MSRVHTVVSGDRLTRLSAKFYGTENKASLIVEANPQLAGRKISAENLPTINPGDKLIIPDEAENVVNIPQKSIVPDTIEVDDDSQVTILVDGKQFAFFSSYTITEIIDSLDSFEFGGPFDDTIQVYRDAFRPLSYNPCAVYYGPDLVFNGIMIAPASESNVDSKTLSVVGYPRCGVLNDCPMPITKYPVEFLNQNLQSISKTMAQPFGIPVEFQADPGNIFEKVAPEPEQNVLNFLSPLAQQRGILLTNNPQGGLLFWTANIDGIPVASIREGELPYLSCKPAFGPQNYYSHITGLSPTEDEKPAESFTVANPFLVNRGVIRPFTYTVEDGKDTDLQASVTAKAARMFANSGSYELRVQGHRDQNGNKWKKNTLISVLAPGGMIYRETIFIIRSPRLTRDSESGDTTVMNLVLPEAYSSEIPEVVPWEE